MKKACFIFLLTFSILSFPEKGNCDCSGLGDNDYCCCKNSGFSDCISPDFGGTPDTCCHLTGHTYVSCGGSPGCGGFLGVGGVSKGNLLTDCKKNNPCGKSSNTKYIDMSYCGPSAQSKPAHKTPSKPKQKKSEIKNPKEPFKK